jgi:hypothetical protein
MNNPQTIYTMLQYDTTGEGLSLLQCTVWGATAWTRTKWLTADDDVDQTHSHCVLLPSTSSIGFLYVAELHSSMDVGCYVNFLLLRSDVWNTKTNSLSFWPTNIYVILRMSSLPCFGKGSKVLSDRLQAARQILTSAGFICRNPSLIEPSNSLVALLPDICCPT